MTQKKWYRPYLVAGLVWVGLLVALTATVTALEEFNQPSFQEEFGLAPKGDIKYICPEYIAFLQKSERHPCTFGEKALTVGRAYAHVVYIVLWILISMPYIILSGDLDARDLMDISFWVAVLLCPWFSVPLVGYAISRFDRWKDARKSRRSEPPLAPPS